MKTVDLVSPFVIFAKVAIKGKRQPLFLPPHPIGAADFWFTRDCIVSKLDDVRRKLLKAVVYAPPVILGSMVATPRAVMGAIGQVKQCNTVAGAVVSIVISSGTNACCPCIPTAVKYDPVKCVDTQCVKSCGTLCTPAQLAATDCKDFCKNCGVVVTGCNKPCQCAFDPKKAKFVCK